MALHFSYISFLARLQMTPFCAQQGKMWEAPQTEPCPSSAQERGPLGGILSPPPASSSPLQPSCPRESLAVIIFKPILNIKGTPKKK